MEKVFRLTPFLLFPLVVGIIVYGFGYELAGSLIAGFGFGVICQNAALKKYFLSVPELKVLPGEKVDIFCGDIKLNIDREYLERKSAVKNDLFLVGFVTVEQKGELNTK